MDNTYIFIISCFALILCNYKFWNSYTIKQIEKEKEIIKGTFIPLKIEEYYKQRKTSYLFGEECAEKVIHKLSEVVKNGIIVTEEEREKINGIIHNLNELIEKNFKNKEEKYFLEEEIKSFVIDLENGLFFEEYNKNVKEKVSELKKELKLTNLFVEEEEMTDLELMMYEKNQKKTKEYSGYLKLKEMNNKGFLNAENKREIDLLIMKTIKKEETSEELEIRKNKIREFVRGKEED